MVRSRSRNWPTQEAFINRFRLLFGQAVEFMREEIPPTLENLAYSLKMENANAVFRMLGAVKDWNWLIDNLRLSPSSQGTLSVASSSLVLKSDPHSRHGASIFGVASRSVPEAVMKVLAENGVAPHRNPPANSTAIDCSVWLVEIGDGWSVVLRIEPLVEDTWFDPSRYEPEQEALAAEALERIHGTYETSDMVVVRECLDSYLASVSEIAGSAGGMTVESGCIQHGELGKRVAYAGGQLGLMMMAQGYGARSFLDLARRQPHDPKARGGSPTDPWSGQVAIGEEDCSFLIRDGEKARASWEMAWAANDALRARGSEKFPGIFRPVGEKAIRDAGGDPSKVKYVIAQAKVGKHGAGEKDRVSVGFLVREYQGENSSGWSLPRENILEPKVLRMAIKQAEAHCKRMEPNGEFQNTLALLRRAGVQENKVRVRPQIRARNGLTMAADILNTRTVLHV